MPPARKFETYVTPHLPDLRRYCRSLTRSHWDADDLVQEALLKAFVYFRDTGSDRVTKSFLLRAARLVWIDGNRRRTAGSRLPGLLPGRSPGRSPDRSPGRLSDEDASLDARSGRLPDDSPGRLPDALPDSRLPGASSRSRAVPPPRRGLNDADALASLAGPKDPDYAEIRGWLEWLAERVTNRTMDALLLAEYFGYSMQEIARQLDTTVPAVKSLLFRSKRLIRSVDRPAASAAIIGAIGVVGAGGEPGEGREAATAAGEGAGTAPASGTGRGAGASQEAGTGRKARAAGETGTATSRQAGAGRGAAEVAEAATVAVTRGRSTPVDRWVAAVMRDQPDRLIKAARAGTAEAESAHAGPTNRLLLSQLYSE